MFNTMNPANIRTACTSSSQSIKGILKGELDGPSIKGSFKAAAQRDLYGCLVRYSRMLSLSGKPAEKCNNGERILQTVKVTPATGLALVSETPPAFRNRC